MTTFESNPTSTRLATLSDAPAICEIYNLGISSRLATFETRQRSPSDIEAWFRPDFSTGITYPVVVAVEDGKVLGFAAASSYRSRACYWHVAEYSVYVHPDHHRKGLGTLLLEGLFDACKERKLGKLISRIFAENAASRALCRKMGFKEVGIYEKHGKRDDDGIWRDCVVVEKLVYDYWDEK